VEAVKIEYEIIQSKDVDESVSKIFDEMLRKQGKVGINPKNKANRCMLLCIVRSDGDVAAIAAIKKKTKSDFSDEKAGLPDLAGKFEWELGYFYTAEKYSGQGIASNAARLLLDSYGSGNLMASTEVSANPGMVKILERLGFRLFGKPWKSSNHENYLGLFLRFK